MIDERGAFLLHDSGWDRYGRDLDTIRRNGETAAELAVELRAIVARLERGEVQGGREGSTEKVIHRARLVVAFLERCSARDHELATQPWRPDGESEIEADGAGAIDVGPAEALEELPIAETRPVAQEILAQLGDEIDPSATLKVRAYVLALDETWLAYLCEQAPWRPSHPQRDDWAQFTPAERTHWLELSLASIAQAASGGTARGCDNGTRTVRSPENVPANQHLSSSPADS